MTKMVEFLYLHQRIEILITLIGSMKIDIDQMRFALDELFKHVDRSRSYLTYYDEIQHWANEIREKKWNTLCLAFDDFIEQVRPLISMIEENLIVKEVTGGSPPLKLPGIAPFPENPKEEGKDGDDDASPIGS